MKIENNKKDYIQNYSELKKLIEEHLKAFELKELIGQGSESHVYKSLVKKMNQPVSMKIVSKDKNHTKNSNEIKIANKLKHKNIIKFFGMETIKNEKCDINCLIMEYSKFGNLRQFQKNIIKRAYLTESTLCYFSFLILDGLKYCHMNKIAHFDIKPQNIIIDETLNIKIIDFSISMDYRNKNEKIKLPHRGTPNYMAPEVKNSELINTSDLEKIDLFSFGVMLYHFAFGSFPYESLEEEGKEEETEGKIDDIMEKNKFNYSNYFFEFLKKLIEKDINKRINIEQAMEHYWIKGGKLLLEEKEKLNNANIFLSYLIFDYFPSFNEYISN